MSSTLWYSDMPSALRFWYRVLMCFDLQYRIKKISQKNCKDFGLWYLAYFDIWILKYLGSQGSKPLKISLDIQLLLLGFF